MNDSLSSAITTILHEILNGSAPTGGWLLNANDPGLLVSLDRLSAADASVVPAGGTASIAAHVEHLRFGLGLLNRWTREENPFANADWSAAWRRTQVSDDEWTRLRDALRTEARNWQAAFPAVGQMGERGLTGVLASAAHLAYHFGAIRQLSPRARGPSAAD